MKAIYSFVLILLIFIVLTPPLKSTESIPRDLQKYKLLHPDFSFFKQNFQFKYILGTDEFGKSLIYQLIIGFFNGIKLSISSLLISLFAGLTIGTIYFYGNYLITNLINSVYSIILSFPHIIIVIFFIAFFGSNFFSIIFFFGFTSWIIPFQHTISEIESVQKKDFYIFSVQLGYNKFQLFLYEILPTLLPRLIVSSLNLISTFMIADSALNFLGLGYNYPSVGKLIASGNEHLFSSPTLLLIPSFLIIVFILLINILTEWISKKL